MLNIFSTRLFLFERYDRELAVFETFSTWLIDYACQIFEVNYMGTAISVTINFQKVHSTPLESSW